VLKSYYFSTNAFTPLAGRLSRRRTTASTFNIAQRNAHKRSIYAISSSGSFARRALEQRENAKKIRHYFHYLLHSRVFFTLHTAVKCNLEEFGWSIRY